MQTCQNETRAQNYFLETKSSKVFMTWMQVHFLVREYVHWKLRKMCAAWDRENNVAVAIQAQAAEIKIFFQAAQAAPEGWLERQEVTCATDCQHLDPAWYGLSSASAWDSGRKAHCRHSRRSRISTSCLLAKLPASLLNHALRRKSGLSGPSSTSGLSITLAISRSSLEIVGKHN